MTIARLPAARWLLLIGATLGLFFGIWLGRFVGAQIGCLIGLCAGILFGLLLCSSTLVRQHWFEVCYWTHYVIAYFTVILAFVARFDVFWPAGVTWGALIIDKLYQRCACTYDMFILPKDSRCITDVEGKPLRLRLVLELRSAGSAEFNSHDASRWVYLSCAKMLDESAGWLDQRVARAWHPLSLASAAGNEIELLIDVHHGIGGRKSWSELLFAHVYMLKRADGSRPTLYGAPARELAAQQSRSGGLAQMQMTTFYAAPSHVQLRGPFGSAFSRCLEMKRRVDRVDAAKYDIVVIFGSGLGLPSALSALREFVHRRAKNQKVPPFVWFLWQCRHPEDLQLCWDSLHRIIYGAGGLCTYERYTTLVAGDRTKVASLDYVQHARRHGGETWSATSWMLDWLGVTMHVSKMTESGLANLRAEDPLLSKGVSDGAAVHEWLCDDQRLCHGKGKGNGYHDLAGLLQKLDAKASEHVRHQAASRSVCVSLCGSRRAMEQARAHMLEAKKEMSDSMHIDFELAADYHG